MFTKFFQTLSSHLRQFTPKSIVCLQEGYTVSTFFSDLSAGISVGIISLPLVMAFAISAGVAPEHGLYTAITAGIVAALLSGSRYQISGPTGTFVVIVYSIIQRHGFEDLALATFLAGFLLCLMGIFKCGTFIRFIPYPVTTGFISGIATVLFTAQLRDFLGLHIDHPSAEFTEKITEYWQAIGSINFFACALGIITLLLIVYFRKVYRKIPGAVLAIIVTSTLVYLFELPVETIESMFGPIPHELPDPHFPEISLTKVRTLFPDAIAIALLGAIESLLSCMIADTMTGKKHSSNLELLAQGIGNCTAVLFGGIPATGAIARTTTNVQLHAKTPFAAIIHAITILLLMVFLAPFCGKIPLASLAAILIFIAYNMSEIERFHTILRGPRSDRAVLITTYFMTVFFDLTVAAQAGILLSAFLFLKHMAEKTTTTVYQMLQESTESDTNGSSENVSIPQGTQIFEVEGPFFFGVSDMLSESYRQLQEKPRHIILKMKTVPLIDSSGMQALKTFYDKCTKDGVQLTIIEVRPDVMRTLQKGGVLSYIGTDHFT